LTIPDDDPVLGVDADEMWPHVCSTSCGTCWTLPSRAPDEDELMVNAAHVSLYHWVRVGEPVNEARGEWQVSRVYAVLHRGEPALHHARRSLAICERDGMGDLDLAFAYEAMSRAHMVGGDDGEASRFAAVARTAADRIAEEEDRQLFLGDLADLPGAGS
jgi:hypothetical protein